MTRTGVFAGVFLHATYDSLPTYVAFGKHLTDTCASSLAVAFGRHVRSFLASVRATHIKEYPWNVCVHDSLAVPCCPARFPSLAAVAPRLSNASATKSRGTEHCVADLAVGEARRHIAATSESEGKAGPGGHAENWRRRDMRF